MLIAVTTLMIIQAKTELEKVKRKQDADLQDYRDNVEEKLRQLEDFQSQLARREEELTAALTK